MTLLFQLLFPLSLAFSPIITTAHTPPLAAASEPYIIGPGETLQSVAKQHQLSFDQLKQLNAWRTFAKPFATLGVGDEIDVPRRKSPFTVDPHPPIQPLNVDTILAQGALSGGQLLANDNSGKAAVNMARSAALNQANSASQQWLAQFGTARVQLNANDNLHLDGSELDLLLPLYDIPSTLLFTQLGARNKDSRNTVNIGAGLRVFHNYWMFGTNTFFDNDITGKNRRAGVGVEAWTDYLKLSANSYFRLTSWHQSRDFVDYNERPANGYDIRAEAYLPVYPQLGGKLMFEQYRGEEVALFGKDERQKNPRAVTAGLNYTPVSLVTLGAEHRAGSNGKNDSRINFQLNYRLGESWQSHISPSAVATTRTLAGNRYDLVDRNNHIILDYQKQEIIRLTLPESITYYAGHTTPLTAEITAKYGLSHIDWDSTALVAAGGTVIQTAPRTLTITLPPYQHSPSRNINNTYTLSAVAHDNQGNVSNRAVTQIIVMPQTASEGHSQTQALPETLPADGVSTSQIIVRLHDSDNQPITGAASQLALPFSFVADAKQKKRQPARSPSLQLGEITETSPGEYQALLTAGTDAGKVTIRPTANEQILPTVTVSLTPDDVAADNSILIVSPATIVANNSEVALLTFTARNSLHAPVHDLSVHFEVTGVTGTNMSTVWEHDDGVYSAILTGITTGNATVTPKVNGLPMSSLSQQVMLIADHSTAELSIDSVIMTTNNSAANGEAVNIVQATVTDHYGNLVSDEKVTFSVLTGDANVVTVTGTTDDQGKTSTALVSTEAGNSTIQATLNNGRYNTTIATFTADKSTAVMTLREINNYATANGTATNEVQAMVTDVQGNPLPGTSVHFSADNGATLSASDLETDNDGIASITLTNITVGITTVTALMVGGQPQNINTTFTTIADTGDLLAGSVVMGTNNSVANGEATNTVQATVTDHDGNPVIGQVVTFNVTEGEAKVVMATASSDAKGVATTTLTSTKAGDSTVQATLDNGRRNTTVATFKSGEPAISKSTLAATPTTITANGSNASTVTLTLNDAFGNAVSGQSVTFTSDLAVGTSFSDVTDHSDGIYTAMLTSTRSGSTTLGPGSMQLGANVNNNVFAVPTVAITLDRNFVPQQLPDNGKSSPITDTYISNALNNNESIVYAVRNFYWSPTATLPASAQIGQIVQFTSIAQFPMTIIYGSESTTLLTNQTFNFLYNGSYWLKL